MSHLDSEFCFVKQRHVSWKYPNKSEIHRVVIYIQNSSLYALIPVGYQNGTNIPSAGILLESRNFKCMLWFQFFLIPNLFFGELNWHHLWHATLKKLKYYHIVAAQKGHSSGREMSHFYQHVWYFFTRTSSLFLNVVWLILSEILRCFFRYKNIWNRTKQN